jgi:hypothetical protein
MPARVIVFTGPTLSAADARAYLDADYRAPVAQGDLYRAAREQPWGIAIIDGYFEHVPAVWHKEILWALKQGIHVYGAASMGALRAAELQRYGMVGVGRVFRDLADGRLEDDDEVAVAEGPSPTGAVHASVAMVDVRATLEAAREAAVLSEAAHDALLAIAKTTFYAERSYLRLLADAVQRGVEPQQIAALRAFLPRGQVAQKRADAVELLERVARERGSPAFAPRFHFERTDMWQKLVSALRSPSAGSAGANDSAVLEQARADSAFYAQLEARALIRALVSEIVRFEGAPEPAAAVEAAALQFRTERGLFESEALASWLSERGMTPEAFVDAMQDDARLARLRALLATEIEEQLLNELRRDPRWTELSARGRHR